ncbi:TetR/AcrR family transcriptional regulator [Subtercola boreus]|uniref:TetR family transcriptional regulator n=1 Tax=Subtercola boreus TaxID=120213 RepID=A0A3E0WGD4_9MICO|nr:TetR/AcrR family transcriptional regulator [Subtercola boreus]RFA22755.1 TetR family transcriptional regulator [Subtercola boreus]RFA23110.1 TetR family transcriptional regulator [Subtercola boreus]RFA28863.1 TetR family transcriptional regulator [Subtercola boreus]
MPRAGLDARAVVEAGAALADEVGLDQLSMSVVAERLGVKTPSLYKHVDGLAALTHGIAVLGATEVGDTVRDATQGRAGVEALAAAAQALRNYVKQHPGRYAATTGVGPTGADDPLGPAIERTLASLSAVLHGYRLADHDHIHALRMLRSMLHGFATLEAADGFQLSADIDESFAWMIDFLDRGLRGTKRS